MENISRDNLIDQLFWIIAEVKRRPKEAYFILPEIAVAQIDEGWMKQVEKSTIKRQEQLQKTYDKKQKQIKKQKDNI